MSTEQEEILYKDVEEEYIEIRPDRFIYLTGANKVKGGIMLTDQNEINHPQHYKANGIEVIEIIEAFDLNFRLANTVKYILRAGRKTDDKVKDLEKAKWYLNREIEKLKGGGDKQ